MHKQRGFSVFAFFTFLLGIVVGVAIAAVVAFQVSKAPIPLVDKHTQPGDLRARENWNPNQMLVQTDPSKIGQSTDGQNTQYPQESEDPPAIATLSPGSEHATPSTVPTPPAGGEAASPGGSNTQTQQYFVQAGAFTSASDAEQQRARLAFQGVQATVSQVVANGQTLHRVRVGPYATREAAGVAQKDLAANGVEATVVSAQ